MPWTEPGGEVGLRLTLNPDDSQAAATAPEASAIFGDKPVRSDHPLIRRLRISVDEIIQTWGPHASERDCG